MKQGSHLFRNLDILLTTVSHMASCNLQNLIFEDWISKIHFVSGNQISSNKVHKNGLIDKTGLNVVGI